LDFIETDVGPRPPRDAGHVFALRWLEPVDAFLCFSTDPYIAFFESRGEIGPRSRYSYLCVDPFRVMSNVSLRTVEAELAAWRFAWRGAPVPFIGGAAGFCSYELAAETGERSRLPCLRERAGPAARPWAGEGSRPGPSEFVSAGEPFADVPNLQFGIYDLVFAWDHAARRMWLLCAFEESRPRAQYLLARLDARAPPATSAPSLAWHPTVARGTHMARVARTLDYIRAGDIYQANITAPFIAARPAGVHARDIFLALRAGNAAPFTCYIDCGNGCAVASVSPERFIAVSADGAIETRPIKGTRRRGATAADDAAEAALLCASGKDRAENLMIVDLLRNDISRVAIPGSVRVPLLCALESFPSVHHLISVVEGQLQPGRSAIDLLLAALPGGSITGAPKIRAMDIIAELEGTPRGPYCGTAAWLGFDGAMDSSVLIRTVTVVRDRVVAQAGGGIVAESDPAAEWDEVLVKVLPMLRALGGMS
jgi:para-aminobenzoate synthetase component 1